MVCKFYLKDDFFLRTKKLKIRQKREKGGQRTGRTNNKKIKVTNSTTSIITLTVRMFKTPPLYQRLYQIG